MGTVAGGDRDHEPQFTRPIGNLTAAVGREAVLACTVDHLGNHRVGWLRAEDQTVLSLHTSMVSHNPRITLTHDNYQSWQLHIRQVKESDKGCYMCQVNTKVMKKQIGCLDVHVPPDFLVGDTSGDMAVQEGDNATMICKATGNPQPRVTWKREDGQKILQRRGLRDTVEVDILAGEEMHFWKVDRRQMGSYLCIASNEVPPAVSKRVYLAVNFAPVIKVPNQLLGAPLYTTVTLECHVEAFPNTINYWVKNRQEMLLNGSKYAVWENQTGYYKVVMWLSILTFRPTDIGTYNCISTNSLGKAEGTLRLYGLADTSASESSKSKSTTTVESSAASLQFSPSIIALALAIAFLQLCRHIPLKLS
ncbi:lachesin [Nilaparvata lugens]|uniref:lachesin n=1 Tax=Nilaparvata lugens TaxID=108931 RepID=UPI00193DF985|nr:lachesin [Nilaparvata lugens]